VQKLADPAPLVRDPAAMQEPTLYSIQEARRLLGGISRNTIYQLLRTGELASVVIGCRRFISRAAIDELIARSTTKVSPSRVSTRSRATGNVALPLSRPFPRRGRPLRA
jgi:excisionase family DNA binding protein